MRYSGASAGASEAQIFGDPDFCTLSIEAGDQLGLPSPGHTSLTAKPNSIFTVDSFFDITYRIDFQGCPGSALEGFGGSTIGTVRMEMGNPVVAAPVPGITGARLWLLGVLVFASGVWAIRRFEMAS